MSDKTPKSLKKKKSSSANTTPTDNAVKHGKISSFLNKLTQSEKKKARKDLLKPKVQVMLRTTFIKNVGIFIA